MTAPVHGNSISTAFPIMLDTFDGLDIAAPSGHFQADAPHDAARDARRAAFSPRN
ncbi:MAG: CbtB-domain containing protein [Roseovarius sp.]|nr:CbtB-domain containing protein [Roseovarius sp.]MCY4207814.1 CbtB-domain containing protein [Roseovarius sp.]MCY4291712.1 CbtB-domain containing protein [Roseovarius sp.]MCY4317482.1 CbtB-domain containing protein [Roseovarius sp.]